MGALLSTRRALCTLTLGAAAAWLLVDLSPAALSLESRAVVGTGRPRTAASVAVAPLPGVWRSLSGVAAKRGADLGMSGGSPALPRLSPEGVRLTAGLGGLVAAGIVVRYGLLRRGPMRAKALEGSIPSTTPSDSRNMPFTTRERARAMTMALEGAGFTLVHPFNGAWYNELVRESNLPVRPLPTFGRPGGDCLAFLVGNTKEAWPPFKAWLAEKGEAWRTIVDPFDTYTAACINKAVALAFAPAVGTDVFWAADRSDRLICMQRVAMVSGVATFDTVTHLTAHPRYGPWISWRAVVVVDAPPADLSVPSIRPLALPLTMPAAVREQAQALSEAAGRGYVEGGSLHHLTPDPRSGAPTPVWQLFLALRDLADGAPEWRFPRDQLEYHYTKNSELLAPA